VAGRPRRILAPLLAAGMIALSLERLGFLHWAAGALLFALLAGFVIVNEIVRRRADGEDR